LAVGWIAATLTWRLPEPYFLIGFLTPLMLIPVQQHINRINALAAPEHDGNSRFGAWNWVAVVAGGLFAALVVLGATQRR
jgi:hypothetical protein